LQRNGVIQILERCSIKKKRKEKKEHAGRSALEKSSPSIAAIWSDICLSGARFQPGKGDEIVLLAQRAGAAVSRARGPSSENGWSYQCYRWS
jgi:hypothetical protein